MFHKININYEITQILTIDLKIQSQSFAYLPFVANKFIYVINEIYNIIL